MQSRDERAREIQQAIGAVLLRSWDPIGVRDEPQAHDEYDSYVAGVYRLLASRSSPEQIAEHLATMEAKNMGSSRTDPTRLLPIAEELLRLDIRLDRTGAS